ncbi:hypothetical protein OIV83_005420 [Microbotryomycetes sp. JL201]|nr:hypothetical protein OIV83_005420 [Microbotryomycetes sp. JL201]
MDRTGVTSRGNERAQHPAPLQVPRPAAFVDLTVSDDDNDYERPTPENTRNRTGNRFNGTARPGQDFRPPRSMMSWQRHDGIGPWSNRWDTPSGQSNHTLQQQNGHHRHHLSATGYTSYAHRPLLPPNAPPPRQAPPGGFASSASAFKPVTSAKARAFEQMKTEHRQLGVPIAIPQNEPYRKPAPANYSGKFSLRASSRETIGTSIDSSLPNISVPDNLSSADLESALAELVESNLNIQDEDSVVDGPEGLSCKLLDHQKQGLAWLLQRETEKARGGILADDMGLGKTVQMIALMLANPPKKELRDSEGKRIKTTLIVCTPALMDQWEQELKQKAPDCFSVAIHHGDKKLKSGRALRKHDVIITTYPTLQSEWPDPKGGRKMKGDSNGTVTPSARGALFDVESWYRVILDEAHIIKNRTTKQHKACCELDSHYRWCLTGTPVQNGVMDIFSLFEFLGPVAKPLHEIAEFKAKIETPIKNKRAKIGFQRLAAVLSVVMLRRNKATKIDGKSILPLPPREVIVVSSPFMDPDELEFYQALESKIALTVNSFIKHGGLEAKTIDALSLLLRMRQACSHPSLVTKKGVDEDDDPDSLEKTAARTNPSTPVVNKLVAKDELDDLLSGLGALSVQAPPTCLVCPSPAKNSTAKYCQDCNLLFEKHSKLHFSTKVRQLLKCLNDIRKEGRGHKTIVFSQFTSMFDIVEPFLKSSGFKFVRFDGKKTGPQRAAALKAIRDDPEVTVLLLSLKSGSVGLNLTCCSRVILMDLWWNPQASLSLIMSPLLTRSDAQWQIEEQAYGRAHRYPQKEVVKIFKLTITNTVEDRILKLQEEKAAVASAVVDGDAAFSSKANKLSVREMLYLFRGDGEPQSQTGGTPKSLLLKSPG